MRIELIRMVADWLRGDDGVNAVIPSVPLDSTDEPPPELPVVEMEDGEWPAVYDVTRHAWAANRGTPPVLPCLTVSTEGAFDLHGEEMTGTHRDVESPPIIVVRYWHARHDTAAGITDGEYTLRAAMASVARLMRQENEASRRRNDVLMYGLERASLQPVDQSQGEAQVSGALLLEPLVRDFSPFLTP